MIWNSIVLRSVILILFLLPAPAPADEQPVAPSLPGRGASGSGAGMGLQYEHVGDNQISFTARFDTEDFAFSRVAGLDRVQLPMWLAMGQGKSVMSYASGYGAPLVPRVRYRFALPPGALP
jgi:hypothetical protein